MGKTRALKEKMVEEIKERFQKANTAVVTDFRGLSVSEITELRRQLREEGVEYKVLKNTLTCFALDRAGLEELKPYIEGPTAVAFGYNDPVVPAKLLVKFAEENEKLKLKVGFLEGNILDVEQLRELAKLPSMDVLRGQVAGAFQVPLIGLLSVLQAFIRNFVYAVEALRQQKEAREGA